jgi:O-antigen biosynthesis protein
MATVLILSSIWCEPQSSAAGKHLLQLIKELQAQGYAIHFAATANPSPNAFDLESIGVSSLQIGINTNQFDQALLSIEPDIIIFDRFLIEEQLGWKLREFFPKALTILNTEDLHSLRHTRAQALKENIHWTPTFYKNQEITLRELAALYRCNLVLLVSKAEIELVQTHFLGLAQKLVYHPLHYQLTPTQNLPNFEERTNFYSIGNFMHAPNLASLQWIQKEIWPIIRQALPAAEFHAYGSYVSTKAQALNMPKNGFFIKGFLPDTSHVLPNYKVCLAPLSFGAGVKGKLLEAMHFGTPNVTTKIGAEGLFFDNKWPGFIAETTAEIAKAAITLYTDNTVWLAKQVSCSDTLSNYVKHSEEVFNFELKLTNAIHNLQKCRSDDFFGQLLLQNQFNANKYLAKWIAEKNKR